MGYNEWQYALPRWQDLSISRQGMFDNTFHYTPTVGWMIMPLTTYHTWPDGPAATFEPVSKHKVAFNWALSQYFGAGVSACYQGYHLYDSEETKEMVVKWVSFFKKYRDILTSDTIHVRRPDMQGLDAILHVNPRLTNKGLLMVYNPTNVKTVQRLRISLYYTGLTVQATFCEQAANCSVVKMDRGYNAHVQVELGPLGVTWYLIQ